MARKIGDGLGRGFLLSLRPSGDTLTEVFGREIAAVDKAFVLGVHQPAFDGVSGVVAKSADMGIQFADMVFRAERRAGADCTFGSAPRLAVNQLFSPTKTLIQRKLDAIHQFGIQKSHQIESETVDMVFFCPIEHRIHDIAGTHAALTGQFVAAAGTVGGSAILILTVIVPGNRSPKPGIQRIGVVVDNIHDHAEAVIVQGLDGFLQFADAHFAVPRIGGIAALGNIVVRGIIAPVVLSVRRGLIHGAVIIDGHELDMGHTETLEIVDAGRVNAVMVQRGAGAAECPVTPPLFLRKAT